MTTGFKIVMYGSLGVSVYFFNTNQFYSLLGIMMFICCVWTAGKA